MHKRTAPENHRSTAAGTAACLGVLLLSAVLLSACGTRVGALYEKVLGSPTYAGTTETYTRTKEVHDGLETRFILSATWLSPP